MATRAPGEAGSADQERDHVKSLERGLDVIRAFSADRRMQTLSEVAEVTGMTRASARRFLLTLEKLGYVGSTGRQFFLRPRVLSLGQAYLSSIHSWTAAAEPHLRALAERTQESCGAAVLDGASTVYVASVNTKRIMSTNIAVGSRLPAFCTSVGRVLLAHLPTAALDEFLERAELTAYTDRTVTDANRLRSVLERVKRQGWALDDQELEIGLRSVAVPLRDPRGELLAALNISAHATRVSKERLLGELLSQLRETADAIRLEHTI